MNTKQRDDVKSTVLNMAAVTLGVPSSWPKTKYGMATLAVIALSCGEKEDLNKPLERVEIALTRLELIGDYLSFPSQPQSSFPITGVVSESALNVSNANVVVSSAGIARTPIIV